jgi:hypothetical protein
LNLKKAGSLNEPPAFDEIGVIASSRHNQPKEIVTVFSSR